MTTTDLACMVAAARVLLGDSGGPMTCHASLRKDGEPAWPPARKPYTFSWCDTGDHGACIRHYLVRHQDGIEVRLCACDCHQDELRGLAQFDPTAAVREEGGAPIE